VTVVAGAQQTGQLRRGQVMGVVGSHQGQLQHGVIAVGGAEAGASHVQLHRDAGGGAVPVGSVPGGEDGLLGGGGLLGDAGEALLADTGAGAGGHGGCV